MINKIEHVDLNKIKKTKEFNKWLQRLGLFWYFVVYLWVGVWLLGERGTYILIPSVCLNVALIVYAKHKYKK